MTNRTRAVQKRAVTDLAQDVGRVAIQPEARQELRQRMRKRVT